MAKVIPTKKAKLDKEIESNLKLFYKATEARGRIGQAAFDAQDEETQEAIRVIRDRLTTIATGTIRVFPKGRKQGGGITVQIDQVYVDANTLYIATEIVKDLAFLDIRVANYEFPNVYCNECGVKLTPNKQTKKIRKGGK